MRVCEATLKSLAAYSQSRHYTSEEAPPITAKSGAKKETPRDYEARTWRYRMHADDKGEVFIPPMAFKNCLAEAAKFSAVQIPGKGKATYTKHFEAGVMVTDPLMLGVQRDGVPGEWLFVPSTGRRGDGSRVDKCFPCIRSWEGVVKFVVLDDVITEEVFEQTLREAGTFIGIGRFRPRNNGYYGRFEVVSVKWVSLS